jgi:hypothetical protein
LDELFNSGQFVVRYEFRDGGVKIEDFDRMSMNMIRRGRSIDSKRAIEYNRLGSIILFMALPF